MMWFAKDLKKAWLINKPRITVGNMNFKVMMAAAIIAFKILIKSNSHKLVAKLTMDGVIFIVIEGVFFRDHVNEF